MAHRIARSPARSAAALASSILMPIVAGCGALAVHVHATAGGVTGTSSGLVAAQSAPLSRDVARRLPDGAFYMLAGSNAGSYNLWEISNIGNEIKLTDNRVGYGVSRFGASRAGIVMADASSGLDRIARLTGHGVVFLKDGRGSAPSISSEGQICYIRPEYNKSHTFFQLVVKKSFSAAGRVIYQQRADIIGGGWGPGHAIAIISGGHAPHTTGPKPRLMIVRQNGRASAEDTGFGNSLSNVIWREEAIGLAVTSWNNVGEIISPSGSRVRLPKGWFPAAWSPSGAELLVWGPESSIGIWQLKYPHTVRNIGKLAKSAIVGEIAWLAQPVKF
jgi:hypothetical protein